MKKYYVFFLISILLLSLCACSKLGKVNLSTEATSSIEEIKMQYYQSAKEQFEKGNAESALILLNEVIEQYGSNALIDTLKNEIDLALQTKESLIPDETTSDIKTTLESTSLSTTSQPQSSSQFATSSRKAETEATRVTQPVTQNTTQATTTTQPTTQITSTSKQDFNSMYGNLAGKSWCTIGSDGRWMKIDTRPNNEWSDAFVMSPEYDKCLNTVQQINADLGFSGAVYEKMLHTGPSMGRVVEENENYKVSWTYNSTEGMEAIYEIK